MRAERLITSFFTNVCIVIMLLFYVSSSSATTLIELTLEDLCMKSSDIIITHVKSMNSYCNSEKTRMYTDIYLEVEDTIKGQCQKQSNIKLTLYGGTVDGITTYVVGSPQFKVGEQTLLFLSERQSEKTGKKYFSIVGFNQGKFNLVTDSKTKENKVIRDQKEFPLKLEKNSINHILAGSQSLSLPDFLNYIKMFSK